MTRKVVIVGGGLAGLGLGIALRRHDVPVTICEAGRYPRHRVCGEFITSLDSDTREVLHLDRHLRLARFASGVSWCEDGKPDIMHRLPQPALCLSRHCLDQTMAADFVASGGELKTGTRVSHLNEPGRVYATGRRPDTASPWVGIKQHYRGLALRNDLEVHFGRGGYVGLTQVESETVNVCGLIDRNSTDLTSNFPETLRASGFESLAVRLREAEPVEGSFCAVAGLNYRTICHRDEGVFLIGDRQSLIPPFTGHGMTMALQSAATALPYVHAWARGHMEWAEARTAAMRAQSKRFRPRLRMARAAHPLVLDSCARRWARSFHRLGVLPVALLYRVMH